MPGEVQKDDRRGGDDLSTMDEVRVFKDEGEDRENQDASENLQAELLEEKSSLISENELFLSKHKFDTRPSLSAPYYGFPNPYAIGFMVNPYAAYHDRGSPLIPGLSPRTPLIPDHPLTTPPPAHMGSLHYDKFRSTLYPPITHPQYGPHASLGMEHLAAWHQMSMYQQRPHSPYTLPMSSSSLLPGYPPGLLPQHHLPVKSEHGQPPGLLYPDDKTSQSSKKEPHVKKPLNAFMLYMKEMRPVVQAECTLKESAAINQILGRRWHGLTREEQAVYYEKARDERQKHLELYPNWNARDNYRSGQKTKKRKRDKTDDPAANIKKCRARYGLEQQSLWCKPCKRKKKCIRVQMYLDGRSEQEIEATTFNDDGEAVSDVNVDKETDETPYSYNGEEGSPASQAGSSQSNELSLPSSPGADAGYSLPSLESAYRSLSPSSLGQGSSSNWMSAMEGFQSSDLVPNSRPVGSDPRDSKNPLSISSMTGDSSKRRF